MPINVPMTGSPLGQGLQMGMQGFQQGRQQLGQKLATKYLMSGGKLSPQEQAIAGKYAPEALMGANQQLQQQSMRKIQQEQAAAQAKVSAQKRQLEVANFAMTQEDALEDRVRNITDPATKVKVYNAGMKRLRNVIKDQGQNPDKFYGPIVEADESFVSAVTAKDAKNTPIQMKGKGGQTVYGLLDANTGDVTETNAVVGTPDKPLTGDYVDYDYTNPATGKTKVLALNEADPNVQKFIDSNRGNIRQTVKRTQDVPFTKLETEIDEDAVEKELYKAPDISYAIGSDAWLKSGANKIIQMFTGETPFPKASEGIAFMNQFNARGLGISASIVASGYKPTVFTMEVAKELEIAPAELMSGEESSFHKLEAQKNIYEKEIKNLEKMIDAGILTKSDRSGAYSLYSKMTEQVKSIDAIFEARDKASRPKSRSLESYFNATE